MKAPKGELREHAGGRWSTRVRLGKDRIAIDLGIMGKAMAEERGLALAALAQRLASTPHREQVLSLLRLAGVADARRWAACVAAAEDLATGRAVGTVVVVGETVLQFGLRWTSGELHKLYPDHVRPKASAHKDHLVLTRHVYPVIGDLPIAAVTLEHADTVMARVPRDLSAATRRHIAQALRRLLALATYPAKLRVSNPLPRGWLPSLGSAKAKDALYPEEDAILLGCEGVPLVRRLAYGLMTREGFRKSEVAALQWSDIDLRLGFVRLDKNKTKEPRTWDLSPDVINALRTYREIYGGKDKGLVLAVPSKRMGTSHLAMRLRADLRLAGITRPELFERSKTRLPIRAHDLRATFVTIALAAGRSETWISDRTGHKSSAMIRTYQRQARRYAARDLVALASLGLCLPELRLPHDCPKATPQGRSETGTEPKTRPDDEKESTLSNRFLISRSMVRTHLGTQKPAKAGTQNRPVQPRSGTLGAMVGAMEALRRALGRRDTKRLRVAANDVVMAWDRGAA